MSDDECLKEAYSKARHGQEERVAAQERADQAADGKANRIVDEKAKKTQAAEDPRT